jgi:hypothetical protein
MLSSVSPVIHCLIVGSRMIGSCIIGVFCSLWLYNQHLPQKALNHQTPLIALKRWQESHPHLFKKKVISHPGPDKLIPDSPCWQKS